MGYLQWLCFVLLIASVLGQTTPSSGINKAPEWIDDLGARLQQGLYENIPIGTTIGELLAVDPEGLLVEYWVEETETFKVLTNGTVILNRALDRETSVTNPINNGVQLSVTFKAKDPLDANHQQNIITAHHIVTVLDVNDNNPAFQNAPYHAIVKEGSAPVGTTIFSGISVTDADSSLNAVIDISCVPTDISTNNFPCNIFSISQDLIGEGDYVGYVNLNQAVDYELRNTYVFNIFAKDDGTPSLNVTIGIIINVEDLPDSPPVFLNGRQSIVMRENIPAGVSVGFLQARDGDRGISNPVKIIITNDPFDLFSIGEAVNQGDDSYRAEILVQTPVDRENKDTLGRYEFSVRAIEMVNGVEDLTAVADSIVIVDILDVNDNPPTFDKSEYTVEVPEIAGNDQRKGQISDLNMLVTDKDAASFGSFSLIVESQSPPTFSAFPKDATGSTPVNLYVEEPMYMDYEKPEYRTQIVTIIAYEMEQAGPGALFRTSTATVTVILTDINDNSPEFDAKSYRTPIVENHAVGTPVTQITANDADSGLNGQITYSLQGTGSEFFKVDSSTGLVTLELEVDYETKRLFQIYFVASDHGLNPRSNSVLLSINVTDYNDVGPVFDPKFYQTIITESSTDLQPPITVSATDVEQNMITYHIISGNLDNDPFVLHDVTGVLSLIRFINYLETDDTGFVELTVIASDNGLPIAQTSTTIITITVRDENNHIPVFDPSDVTTSISENAIITSEVVTITATDADAGSNGNIRYYIAGGSSDHFSIGSTSGMITVSERLDRDLIPVYILIVIGQDQGSPPESGTATVTVILTDANNKDPIFLQDVYLVSISDELSIGSLAETVQAEDTDSSNDLSYSIVSSSITARDSNSLKLESAFPFDFRNAFGIDSKTGAITTRLVLNHDQAADVSFNVQVQDLGGLPSFQVASASVIIRIYGITESRPFFAAPWTYDNRRYSLSISEDLPQGSSIFTFVARDASTGTAITRFEEIGGVNNYLKVDLNSGDLLLESFIDFEVLTIKQISISVRAFSADGLRFADATMTVSINDVNDNPPEFTQRVYSFSVPESLQYPGRIGSVFAFDNDIGQFAAIEYVIQGQGIDTFQILPEGVIIVREGKTLDYETTSFYSLLVIAIDNPPDTGTVNTGSVRLRATSQLQITLTDVNDNDPVFVVTDPFKSYDFDTVETISINTPIGVVSATDKDSGQNGQVRYSLVKDDNERVDITTHFSIDFREGFLRNYLSLRDQSPNSPFKGYVVATDQGYPFRSTSIVVLINVGSGLLNDGKPLFSVPKIGDVIPIPEDTPNGTFILKAAARPRTNISSPIEYSFLKVGDVNQDKFRIDSVSGIITKQGELDYEVKRTYNLIITAVDVSNRSLNSSRLLTVLVTDVDDNEPMFDNTAGTCYLNLNSVTIPEDKPVDSRITRVQACDADSSLHNAMQYLLFTDDDRCSDNNLDDFGLNLVNGQVYVNKRLDRETKDLYHLCIYVEPASSTGTVIRQTGLTFSELQDLKQALNLTILISDVNDNGPKFDATKNSTVMFNIVPNRPVVFQVNATDDDISPFDYVVYAITNITFASQEQSNLYLGLFSIGYDTGFITPTVADYTKFVGGYFDITVMATDFRSPSMNATIKIKIHVVEFGQRIRLVINQPATESQEDAQNLINDLDAKFPDTKFTISMISYHNDRNGITDPQRTDVCFIAINITDDNVLNLNEVVTRLDQAGAILSTYQASDPGVCQPETTDTFNGYDIFWWVVVALAIFIFVCCVISIIAAHILARNYKRFRDSKTVALVPQ